MNDVEQRKAAKAFAANWQGKGYEKGESQPFWLQLLGEVLGVEHPAQFIKFEGQVMLDHTSFIDAVIPSTHVLIEQKSLGKNLKQPIRQSDGSLLTPFQQAKRYTAEMPYSERPRWIVVSNFEEFHIYDMEKPYGDPEIIYLKDLPTEYYRLQFLVDSGNKHIQKEMEVSIEAGEIVGKLYDALIKQYKDAKNEQSLRSLNMLCVRLVFCLYAEDAGIFGARNMFHDYLEQYSAKELRRAVIELFKVLDTKQEERDPYLDEDLAAFPYVNGGLFAEENIEIPQFTDEIRELLLTRASADFDWSLISPTIFGAVFESTLNPETRRSGGMHYTSIENIHKVIDPLFLYDLRNEFAKIQEEQVKNRRKQKLEAFQKKLASLTFLDPACGSGNFLTETYISLRRLENEVIRLLTGGEMVLGEFYNPIQVSINQFYGIEINDFAVSVAKTALWIAESQMMKETEDIVHMTIDFLPLKTNAYIVEGNALRIDWESVVPKEKLNFIMGNPPFVGIRHSKIDHRKDLKSVISIIPKAGSLDYVTAWYIKAAEFMKRNNSVKTAFVSTNSVVQGEQAYSLWHFLLEVNKFHINFAFTTFKWESESSKQAAVHCVIIGFSMENGVKVLYSSSSKSIICDNINQYLLPLDNIWVSKAKKPYCDVPEMIKGCYPTDNGNYIFTKDEMEAFIQQEPLSKPYFRRWIGSEDMLNDKERYILFLKNANPSEILKMPLVKQRISNVRNFRLESSKEATRRKADTPTLLDEERIPNSTFLVIPVVSSENRKYLPIAYKNPPDICYASAFFIENANLYIFGILNSNVHNAWMRTVCGRLEMRYRYSNTLVYNNLPWPNPTPTQKAKIEKTAQAILEARALYPDNSLADMYGEAMYLFPELLKAHQANDKAVMEAYGFWGKLNSEAACVAELMKMYQQLVEKTK